MPEGRATVFVLQLDAIERIEKRTWLILLGCYLC